MQIGINTLSISKELRADLSGGVQLMIHTHDHDFAQLTDHAASIRYLNGLMK